jgi:hypothetical protein
MNKSVEDDFQTSTWNEICHGPLFVSIQPFDAQLGQNVKNKVQL